MTRPAAVAVPALRAKFEASTLVRRPEGAAPLVRGARPAPGRRRAGAALVGLVIAAVVTAAVLPAAFADAVGRAVAWAESAAAVLSWQVTTCLLAVTVLQFSASAVATRAAVGNRLPFGEVLAAQFAAATASTLTPGGVGGAVVIGRFLTRRGGVRPAAATAAVAALTVIGGVADVVTFAVLISLAAVFGMDGARAEMADLVGDVAQMVPVHTVGSLAVVGGLVGGATVTATAWAPLRRRLRRLSGSVGAFWSASREIVRHPSRLACLASASAATTLLLALGFVATATLAPGGVAVGASGTVLVGYLVAAAVGNAAPTPGGVGTVDAALVGVLVAVGQPVTAAAGVVLAYRLLTFWLPVLVGVPLLRSSTRARSPRRGAEPERSALIVEQSAGATGPGTARRRVSLS